MILTIIMVKLHGIKKNIASKLHFIATWTLKGNPGGALSFGPLAATLTLPSFVEFGLILRTLIKIKKLKYWSNRKVKGNRLQSKRIRIEFHLEILLILINNPHSPY